MKVSLRSGFSLISLISLPVSGSVLAQPAGTDAVPASSGTAETSAATSVNTAVASDTSGDRAPRLAFPALAAGSGLLRMSTTDIAPTGEVRLGLHGEYSQASNFLVKSDRNSRLQGALTLSLSPLPDLEVFAALFGSSNRNLRCDRGESCAAEAREDPEVIKAMGDLAFGVKYARRVRGAFSLGAEAGLRFLSSTGGLSLDVSATSLWLAGLAGYDLRDALGVPIRVHANLGVYIDNSEKLQDFSGLHESTQVVAAFAYGQGGSRVRSAFGVDMPAARVTPDLVLRPFAEYRLDHVVESANMNFKKYLPGLCDLPNSTNPCRDNRSQHAFALGLGAQLFGGPIVSAGLELGVRSVGWPYGSPLPPVNVIVGLTYPLDVRRPKTVTVTVTRLVEAAPKTGFVAGSVASAKGNLPVSDAVVTVVGQKYARTLSDTDGTFQTVEVKPGRLNLEISAANFSSAQAQAVVTAGRTTNVSVSLIPNPPAARVRGRVTLAGGGAVASATVRLSGAKDLDGRTGPDGSFDIVVSPGEYTLRIEAASVLVRAARISVAEGEQKVVDFDLHARPARARVSLAGGALVLKQPVRFAVERGQPTAVLAPDSSLILAEVVDLLLAHPEIRRLRVAAHWDSGLAKSKADALTTDQANAVVSHLVARGIAADRLEGVGMGSGKPRVPNIGRAARMMNRRVEFNASN